MHWSLVCKSMPSHLQSCRAHYHAQSPSVMSKLKPPKTKGVPNKHLHIRTSFLYQAATYLTLQSSSSSLEINATDTNNCGKQNTPSLEQRPSPLALKLGSDLKQVSHKGQLRLALDLKRSVCKSCNSVLVPGRTATHTIENHSKDGKKPWADVLLITCHICGSKKRFPIGATRPLSKSKRKPAQVEAMSATVSDSTLEVCSMAPTTTDQNSSDD